MRKQKKTTRKKAVTKSKKISLNRFSRILLAIGIAFLSVWAVHKILYFRSLQISSKILNTFANPSTYKKQVTTVRVGSRISLSVVESGYVDGRWLISPDKANHVAQTASPGTPGNIIVYAHNKSELFGPLRGVNIGEHVFLTTNDGILHRYIVTKATEVDPANTALLAPTVTETVTLYTCSGFMDSKRFVVQAIPDLDR